MNQLVLKVPGLYLTALKYCVTCTFIWDFILNIELVCCCYKGPLYILPALEWAFQATAIKENFHIITQVSVFLSHIIYLYGVALPQFLFPNLSVTEEFPSFSISWILKWVQYLHWFLVKYAWNLTEKVRDVFKIGNALSLLSWMIVLIS